MELQQQFISGLEDSLGHADYSLLTRRLMDLTEEFEVPSSLRKEILELRKDFLHTESQAAEDGPRGAIGDKARRMIGAIKQQSLTLKHLPAPVGELLVEAVGISKQFTRGRVPFKLYPLDIALRFGEITGVVGENGNGKTTLLRMLAGELSSDSGKIAYPALHTQEGDWYAAKHKFAFIPQRIAKWHGTLLDNLKFFATIHSIKEVANDERVDHILFRLGLDKFRDLTWNEISSGYRLRFELAKMLLWKPRLLILDEPLANLDINAQQLFLQDLRFFCQSVSHPMGIILSSQNLHEIERVADNIIFIRQGKTIYNGPRHDFATDRQQNSFELTGSFDLGQLMSCFSAYPQYRIENTGTSFIISTDTGASLYSLVKVMEQQGLQLSYIRDISQSTLKLFHKDI